MNKHNAYQNKSSRQSSPARKMVRLSIAAAALNPFGPIAPANAQPQVNCSRAIQFGRVVNCTAGGKIGIKPTGTAITDGCIHPLDAINFGKCQVTATIPQTKSIQISFSQTKVNLTGAGTAVLGSFNISTVSGGHVYTFPASSFTSTQKMIPIGGTLTISSTQNDGAYSGSLNIMVSFP